MAKPISYVKTQNDDEVILEMAEPSFDTNNSDEPIGLYFERDGSKRKIDYVLVYERCREKEDEDDDSREEARKLEGMRKAFEESIGNAGLMIERVDRPSATVSMLEMLLTAHSQLGTRHIGGNIRSSYSYYPINGLPQFLVCFLTYNLEL